MTKRDYEVVSGFWHRGEFISPSGDPDQPRTLSLTPEEAKFYVLDGSIRFQPEVTPPEQDGGDEGDDAEA